MIAYVDKIPLTWSVMTAACIFCYFRTLASSGKEFKDPFLKALAQREEANRSGKMTVNLIIFSN